MTIEHPFFYKQFVLFYSENDKKREKSETCETKNIKKYPKKYNGIRQKIKLILKGPTNVFLLCMTLCHPAAFGGKLRSGPMLAMHPRAKEVGPS